MHTNQWRMQDCPEGVRFHAQKCDDLFSHYTLRRGFFLFPKNLWGPFFTRHTSPNSVPSLQELLQRNLFVSEGVHQNPTNPYLDLPLQMLHNILQCLNVLEFNSSICMDLESVECKPVRETLLTDNDCVICGICKTVSKAESVCGFTRCIFVYQVRGPSYTVQYSIVVLF